MGERLLTINSTDYIGKNALGYVLHARIEDAAVEHIRELQDRLVSQFGTLLWLQPAATFHVTILDYVAPLIEYADDKDVLFERRRTEYDTATTAALENVGPQKIRFNRIALSPSAIYLVSDDAARKFNTIRHDFLSRASLEPNTKAPPTIVHSTIARFTREVPFDAVDAFIKSLTVSIDTTIDHLSLDRETQVPMLKHTVVKNYPLQD